MPVLLSPSRCFSSPSRPSWCVLRSVPSGCPFPLPARTPFHAFCAFRGLGPVALQVRTACWCVCVCAGIPAVCALSSLVGVTRALCTVPVQGAVRDVRGDSWSSALPALVPCSACLMCVGGLARVPRLPDGPGAAHPHGAGPVCPSPGHVRGKERGEGQPGRGWLALRSPTVGLPGAGGGGGWVLPG